MRLRPRITPTHTMYVFSAVSAVVLGVLLLPGGWAAAVGFAAALGATHYARRENPTGLSWVGNDEYGLTLHAVQLRNGNWWPNITYKPNVISPPEAVRLLRQAADQITDDWQLDR